VLWTAFAAASAAIAAAVLTQILTNRREVDLWKRRQSDKVWELRVALYVELAGYCQRRLQSLQNSLAGGWIPPNGDIRPPGFAGFLALKDSEQRDLFLARTDLLGPENVTVAYRNLHDTELSIEWAIENDGAGTDITDYGARYLPPEDQQVMSLHRQLNELADALRLAIRQGGI
jgi:hypothetical protein